MPYREVGLMEHEEVLRRWLAGDGLRKIARGTGLDRKTVRAVVEAARGLGLSPGDAWPDEEQLRAFAAATRCRRVERAPGTSERLLLERRDQVESWLNRDRLRLTKVHELLGREGLDVPYASLYRFARKWLEFGAPSGTVRRLEGTPGEFAEVDFGRMGLLQEPASEHPRVVHVFVLVLGYSRLSCVVPSFRQDLGAVLACFEAAFAFLGGCPRRIVFDGMKACVEKADLYTPQLNRSFLEYARFRGFIADPARPRHPRDKPVVERHISYVRERFFKGEQFLDLEDMARHALHWCREVAGRRVHGTTRCVPLEVFENEERAALLPLRPERFDPPQWLRPKVHPDHCIRFDYATYTVPAVPIGCHVDVRADSALVRVYLDGQLIKTHARQPRGGRSIDPEDYPKERSAYAMRFPNYYIRKAKVLGPSVGLFAEQLLDGEFPWSKLRQAQKLLRLGERYGAPRLEDACRRALVFELLNVHRVESILRQALEREPTESSATASAASNLRFLRPSRSFSHQPNQGGNDDGDLT